VVGAQAERALPSVAAHSKDMSHTLEAVGSSITQLGRSLLIGGKEIIEQVLPARTLHNVHCHPLPAHASRRRICVAGYVPGQPGSLVNIASAAPGQHAGLPRAIQRDPNGPPASISTSVVTAHAAAAATSLPSEWTTPLGRLILAHAPQQLTRRMVCTAQVKDAVESEIAAATKTSKRGGRPQRGSPAAQSGAGGTPAKYSRFDAEVRRTEGRPERLHRRCFSIATPAAACVLSGSLPRSCAHGMQGPALAPLLAASGQRSS
jgi:hypothetical protein